jgi:hypothetical protein
MHTLCTAAITGLVVFSTRMITDSRLGSWIALGEPNSRMSAPPEKALPAPVSTMALTAASFSAFSRPIGDGLAGGQPQAVDRRVVQRDDGHVAVDLVLSGHEISSVWIG